MQHALQSWSCRDPKATALITPQVARQFRAVPLRASNGVVAMAMEDPGASNVHAMLDFTVPRALIRGRDTGRYPGVDRPLLRSG